MVHQHQPNIRSMSGICRDGLWKKAFVDITIALHVTSYAETDTLYNDITHQVVKINTNVFVEFLNIQFNDLHHHYH